MPIDIIHPHISHHDNYFIINNPAIYRTNLLQFLSSCISGSRSPEPAFRPFARPKACTPSSSDITLLTTGPSAPNITLTPSASSFPSLGEEDTQDKRFLRVPGGEIAKRLSREREKERQRQREGGCEGSFRCRCRGCGKKRGARIAAIKRRRVRRVKDEEREGERSEVEG